MEICHQHGAIRQQCPWEPDRSAQRVRSRFRWPGRRSRLDLGIAGRTRAACHRAAALPIRRSAQPRMASRSRACSRSRSRTPCRGRTARPVRRVVAGGVAARHEHLAIGQQGGGVAVARCDHLPGGGPGPAGGVVQLRRRHSRSRAPCRRAAPWPCRHQPLTIFPVAVQVPLAGSYSSAPLVESSRPTLDVPHEHPAVAQQRGREAGVAA